MKRVTTRTNFQVYEKIFSSKEVILDEFGSFLKQSLEDLDNDDLEILIYFLDGYLISTNSIYVQLSFTSHQTLVFQEYIKRVLKTEELKRKEDEIKYKEQSEARKRLQQLRIEQMNRLSKDPLYTGILPLDKTEEARTFEERIKKNG